MGREPGVHGRDARVQLRPVTAREYAGHDDERLRRLLPALLDDGLDARRHGRGALFGRFEIRQVVSRAGLHDEDFRRHSRELAVVETAKECHLRAVAAPAEVRGVPAEERFLETTEQVRVIECAPPSRDRVADEVDVDDAGAGLSYELRVRELRIRVRARLR